MPPGPRILAFAGSTRDDSLNKKVLRVAVKAAEAEGAEVTRIDLRSYALPLYDGDLERREGLPERALALRMLFLAHQGLLIAAPEYNGSVSAVLKNTIDWLSRPIEGETEYSLTCFRGKVAGILSASPGPFGGLRGLAHLRDILTVIGVIVVPEQWAVRSASADLADGDVLRDPLDQRVTERVARRLVEVVRRVAV